MNANLRGTLYNLGKAVGIIKHNGKSLTRKQLKALCEYGIRKGYEHTGQFSDEEVDAIIAQYPA